MDIILVLMVVAAIVLFLYGGEQTVVMVQSPEIPKAEKAGCGGGIIFMLILAALVLLSIVGYGDMVLSGLDATSNGLRNTAAGISEFRQQQYGDYPIP